MFRITTEQHAMRKQDGNAAITIHVVNRLAFESVPTGGILATPVI